jgi:hypothetical protein
MSDNNAAAAAAPAQNRREGGRGRGGRGRGRGGRGRSPAPAAGVAGSAAPAVPGGRGGRRGRGGRGGRSTRPLVDYNAEPTYSQDVIVLLNLPYLLEREKIEALLNEFNPASVRISARLTTAKLEPEQASAAVAKLNGSQVGDKQIRVEFKRTYPR